MVKWGNADNYVISVAMRVCEMEGNGEGLFVHTHSGKSDTHLVR